MEADQVYESPRGTRVVIRENTPERISIERTMPPRTGPGPRARHIHTETRESFELLGGDAKVAVDGRELELKRNAAFEIPLRTAHANAYTGDGPATVVQSVAPRPRAVEVYFASWLRWLAEGKTLKNDEPTTLQLAAITQEGGFGGTWVAGVPVFLQRIGLPILGLVAKLKGTRAVRVPTEDKAGRT